MDKNYFRLGQLYSIVYHRRHDYDLQTFLERTGYDINYQIPRDSSAINHKSHYLNYTLLHFAVDGGKEDLIELLLSLGADFTLKDDNNFTPLRLALEIMASEGRFRYKSALFSHIGSKPVLDLLLTAHIDSNNVENPSCNDGISHLHIACLADNVQAAELFLKADGVSVNKSISETSDLFSGWSPLHFAVRYGSENLVELLLKLGADINSTIKFDSPMWPGYTPAHFSAHNSPKIFKLLMEKKANIFAKDAKGITPIDLFIQEFVPTYVIDVLKLDPILKNIQFENGAKLIKAVYAMKNKELKNFVHKIGVNTRLNSRVWPSYTITHLAVTMTKEISQCQCTECILKESSFKNKTYQYGDNNALIEICLELKPSLTIKDANDMTPLHLAFHLCKKNVVDRILNDMILTSSLENCIDREGISHLQIACIVDRIELVEKFLRLGFDPNSPTQRDLTWDESSFCDPLVKKYRAGSTLYHIAAINDSKEMIDVITRYGANMDLLDADGLNAVQVGFLNNGKPWKYSHMLAYPKSQKPTFTSDLNMIHWVRDNRASIEKLSYIDREIINGSSYAEKLIAYAGWTPLHLAVALKNIKAVDVLIEKGADVSARTTAGLNSLHLALKSYPFEAKLIKLLFNVLKTEGEWPDNFGLTRLHVACILKDENEIRSLLQAGEDVNKQINANSLILPGETALHISIQSNSSDEIIKLLLKYGTDLTVRNVKINNIYYGAGRFIENRNDFTLFYHLRKANKVSFYLNTFLATDSPFFKVNSSNNDGLSNFHISCIIGNVDVVKKFIDSGVNVNDSVCPFASEYAGCTPLHLAVKHDNKEVVELLLQSGADWKLENSEGRTPIQCAAASGSSSMLAVIFSNGQIDIQSENAWGETSLSLLLDREPAIYENILDIRINFVDSPIKKEDIARAAWKLKNEFFRGLVDRATDVTKIDADGKNVVHSIGSYECNDYDKVYNCALNVNLWLEKGCNLNHQDKLGRTPLHDAMRAGGAAVKVLLLLGADVNIRDNQGRTAFSYLDHNDIRRKWFIKHILMMSCVGFELDDSLDKMIRSKFDNESEDRKRCNDDWAEMETVNITNDITLHDVLTEEIIRMFPHFHASKRKAILDYFRSENLYETYWSWWGWNTIFQFQYRKILQVMKLLKLEC